MWDAMRDVKLIPAFLGCIRSMLRSHANVVQAVVSV